MLCCCALFFRGINLGFSLPVNCVLCQPDCSREKSVDIKMKHQGRNSMLHSASSLTEHSVQLASFGS